MKRTHSLFFSGKKRSCLGHFLLHWSNSDPNIRSKGKFYPTEKEEVQQFEICSLVFRAFNVQQSTDDKLHEVGLVWYEDSRSSTFSSERNTYV
ncbi:hypothetical protein I3760_02G112300 [Carya illinoinensis]|nr:hypothetical protein I3760_02G112300 [Carya illinoinensis]